MTATTTQTQSLAQLGVFSGRVTVPVKTLCERLTAHGVCQQCAQAVADCLRAVQRSGSASKRSYWTTRALIRLDRCEAGECPTRKGR